MNHAAKFMVFGILLTSDAALCDQADDYYRSALARMARDDFRGAIGEYTKAISLRPDYAEAYMARGRAVSLRAIVDGPYHGRGKRPPTSAMADYSRAIQLKPDYAEAYAERGEDIQVFGLTDINEVRNSERNAAIEANKRVRDSAIADFSMAIQFDANNGEYYIKRAGSRNGNGDYDGAIQDYRAALELEKDPKKRNYTSIFLGAACRSRGILELGRGAFDAAIADFTEAIRRDRTDSMSPRYLAEAQQRAREEDLGKPIRILFHGAPPSASQAEAALVLNVSWMFAGSDASHGFVLDPDLSRITGATGLADNVTGPVTLHFSRLYKKADEPFRVYFVASDGELRLWWSGNTKQAASSPNHETPVQLSPAWLAASKALPPTPEHPAGGISISADASTSSDPLAFFIEFNNNSTYARMGTQ